MRVVLDTNIVIAGLFWDGPPRRVLELGRSGRIDLFTTPTLLAELEDVLIREKFSRRLAVVGLTAHELTLGFAALAELVEPAVILPVSADDPDDDAVLACALAARADAIVSGDRHLLSLGHYELIPIVKAASFVTGFEAEGRGS